MLKSRTIEFLYECLLVIGMYYLVEHLYNSKNPEFAYYVVFGIAFTVIFSLYAIVKFLKAIVKAIQGRK